MQYQGRLLFGLVLILLNRGATLVLPLSTKTLIDRVLIKKETHVLNGIIEILVIAFIIQIITRFLIEQVFARAAQIAIAETRAALQDRVLRLPLSFHNSANPGSLVTRIMTDVEGIRSVIGSNLVEFLGSIVTSLLSIVILVRLSLWLTIITVCTLIIAISMFAWATRRRQPFFAMIRESYADASGRLAEALLGIRIIKSYGAEDRDAAAFRQSVLNLMRLQVQSLKAISLLSAAATLLVSSLSVALTYYGSHLILSGKMTIGDLVTFTAVLAVLVNPLLQIVGIGASLSESLAGLQRTQELAREPAEDFRIGGRRLHSIKEAISFHRVGFAYIPGKPVLHDVSFSVPAGTVAALVGPSGAGKSTIFSLLAGFYSPTGGAITIDGIELKELNLKAYRKCLGIVLQDDFLFSGSIYENVAVGNPDATDRQISLACEIAHVNEFATKLDAGYHTQVGERGLRLSTGQRQRIAIARAVVANPQILLLDEATSSLDAESERCVQNGLGFLKARCTTLMIAHRLSTAKEANMIIVIDDGKIVEQGDHDSLCARRGLYFDLYTKQNSHTTAVAD